MGIDLIIDIAMFYAIWKFAWKKSRDKHMFRAGRADNRDFPYFIVFIVAFIASMVVPTMFMNFGLFTPFAVLGAIVVSYVLTTRITLGTNRYGADAAPKRSLGAGMNNFLGSGK